MAIIKKNECFSLLVLLRIPIIDIVRVLSLTTAAKTAEAQVLCLENEIRMRPAERVGLSHQI